MQANNEKNMAQPDVSATDRWPKIVRLPLLSTEHKHNWVYLSFGFEMCTGCGKIRKVST